MKKIIKSSIIAFSLFLLGMSVQSCETATNVVNKVENKELGAKLAGGWALKTIDRTDVSDAFKGQSPTVFFNLDEHTVTGNSGCNAYNGKFTLIGNMYTPTPMAGTLKACAEENKEPRFLELIGKKSTLVFNNYTLQFVQDGKVVMEFTSMKR